MPRDNDNHHDHIDEVVRKSNMQRQLDADRRMYANSAAPLNGEQDQHLGLAVQGWATKNSKAVAAGMQSMDDETLAKTVLAVESNPAELQRIQQGGRAEAIASVAFDPDRSFRLADQYLRGSTAEFRAEALGDAAPLAEQSMANAEFNMRRVRRIEERDTELCEQLDIERTPEHKARVYGHAANRPMDPGSFIGAYGEKHVGRLHQDGWISDAEAHENFRPPSLADVAQRQHNEMIANLPQSELMAELGESHGFTPGEVEAQQKREVAFEVEQEQERNRSHGSPLVNQKRNVGPKFR